MKQNRNDLKRKKPFYKRWWVIGLFIIAVIIFGSGEDDAISDNPQENSPNELAGDVEEEVALIEYEVVEKEDISFSNVKRFGWDVVVKEPASIDQLKAMAIELIEEAKNESEFNAIVIGFYDYPEFIGNGYTLGKVEYAPEGEWAKADNVRTGQYDKMDYKFELREKDWDKQLNEQEVEIFKARHDLYYSQVSPTNFPDDDEIDNEIAQQFNISVEEIDRIYMKQTLWMFDDNQ